MARFTNVILEIYTMMSTTTKAHIVMIAVCFTVILIIYNAERGSKCEKQLLGCGHLIGVKFHRGQADKGVDSDVPINQLVAKQLKSNHHPSGMCIYESSFYVL